MRSRNSSTYNNSKYNKRQLQQRSTNDKLLQQQMLRKHQQIEIEKQLKKERDEMLQQQLDERHLMDMYRQQQLKSQAENIHLQQQKRVQRTTIEQGIGGQTQMATQTVQTETDPIVQQDVIKQDTAQQNMSQQTVTQQNMTQEQGFTRQAVSHRPQFSPPLACPPNPYGMAPYPQGGASHREVVSHIQREHQSHPVLAPVPQIAGYTQSSAPPSSGYYGMVPTRGQVVDGGRVAVGVPPPRRRPPPLAAVPSSPQRNPRLQSPGYQFYPPGYEGRLHSQHTHGVYGRHVYQDPAGDPMPLSSQASLQSLDSRSTITTATTTASTEELDKVLLTGQYDNQGVSDEVLQSLRFHDNPLYEGPLYRTRMVHSERELVKNHEPVIHKVKEVPVSTHPLYLKERVYTDSWGRAWSRFHPDLPVPQQEEVFEETHLAPMKTYAQGHIVKNKLGRFHPGSLEGMDLCCHDYSPLNPRPVYSQRGYQQRSQLTEDEMTSGFSLPSFPSTQSLPGETDFTRGRGFLETRIRNVLREEGPGGVTEEVTARVANDYSEKPTLRVRSPDKGILKTPAPVEEEVAPMVSSPPQAPPPKSYTAKISVQTDGRPAWPEYNFDKRASRATSAPPVQRQEFRMQLAPKPRERVFTVKVPQPKDRHSKTITTETVKTQIQNMKPRKKALSISEGTVDTEYPDLQSWAKHSKFKIPVQEPAPEEKPNNELSKICDHVIKVCDGIVDMCNSVERQKALQSLKKDEAVQEYIQKERTHTSLMKQKQDQGRREFEEKLRAEYEESLRLKKERKELERRRKDEERKRREQERIERELEEQIRKEEEEKVKRNLLRAQREEREQRDREERQRQEREEKKRKQEEILRKQQETMRKEQLAFEEKLRLERDRKARDEQLRLGEEQRQKEKERRRREKEARMRWEQEEKIRQELEDLARREQEDRRRKEAEEMRRMEEIERIRKVEEERQRRELEEVQRQLREERLRLEREQKKLRDREERKKREREEKERREEEEREQRIQWEHQEKLRIERERVAQLILIEEQRDKKAREEEILRKYLEDKRRLSQMSDSTMDESEPELFRPRRKVKHRAKMTQVTKGSSSMATDFSHSATQGLDYTDNVEVSQGFNMYKTPSNYGNASGDSRHGNQESKRSEASSTKVSRMYLTPSPQTVLPDIDVDLGITEDQTVASQQKVVKQTAQVSKMISPSAPDSSGDWWRAGSARSQRSEVTSGASEDKQAFSMLPEQGSVGIHGNMDNSKKWVIPIQHYKSGDSYTTYTARSGETCTTNRTDDTSTTLDSHTLQSFETGHATKGSKWEGKDSGLSFNLDLHDLNRQSSQLTTENVKSRDLSRDMKTSSILTGQSQTSHDVKSRQEMTETRYLGTGDKDDFYFHKVYGGVSPGDPGGDSKWARSGVAKEAALELAREKQVAIDSTLAEVRAKIKRFVNDAATHSTRTSLSSDHSERAGVWREFEDSFDSKSDFRLMDRTKSASCAEGLKITEFNKYRQNKANIIKKSGPRIDIVDTGNIIHKTEKTSIKENKKIPPTTDNSCIEDKVCVSKSSMMDKCSCEELCPIISDKTPPERVLASPHVHNVQVRVCTDSSDTTTSLTESSDCEGEFIINEEVIMYIIITYVCIYNTH